MREIEFRAWDKKYKLFQFTNGVLKIRCSGNIVPISRGEDIVIQQFTGLKDKNGKKNYEGDIIKYSYLVNNFEKSKGIIGKIQYIGASFKIVSEKLTKDLDISNIEKEVIGNIHENPELLK